MTPSKRWPKVQTALLPGVGSACRNHGAEPGTAPLVTSTRNRCSGRCSTPRDPLVRRQIFRKNFQVDHSIVERDCCSGYCGDSQGEFGPLRHVIESRTALESG